MTVLAEVVRRVGIARRAVNADRMARALARRGIAVMPVKGRVMVACAEQNRPPYGLAVPALTRAA